MPDAVTGAHAEAGSTDPGRRWFFEHYDDAAGQILAFLAADGIELTGKRVADVGAGDGIIDLALVRHGRPAELVGFDIAPTDTVVLADRARAYEVADALPPALRFVRSGEIELPAPDASFDVVVTWSAFEHVGDPAGLLREVRRVLDPAGVFFLQLWPFYHSERGSHLWDWLPAGFHHLVDSPEEVARALREHPEGQTPWAEYMLREFAKLNRMTLDELGSALLAAGLRVRKLEPLTHAVHVPDGALGVPLSQLGIAGVKLLATPG